MPVMKPPMSLLNFTPSSSALPSATLGTAGTTDGLKIVLHGQVPAMTVTLTPLLAVSTLPLSSIARLRIVAGPSTPKNPLNVHVDVPCAARHVAPPSTETSTLAGTPPPLSVAVPVIVTGAPLWTCALAAGDVITEVGGVTSVDWPLLTSGRFGSAPICNVAGSAPMSPNRFTVDW